MQKIFNGQILKFCLCFSDVPSLWKKNALTQFQLEMKIIPGKEWILIRRIYYLAIKKYVEFIIRFNAIIIIDIAFSDESEEWKGLFMLNNHHGLLNWQSGEE